MVVTRLTDPRFQLCARVGARVAVFDDHGRPQREPPLDAFAGGDRPRAGHDDSAFRDDERTVSRRLLGMVKVVPYAAVYQLLPIGMLGFAINLISGMLFFVGIPSQYNANPVFYWKMVFVLLAGLNVTYFMLVDDTWTATSGVAAPVGPRIAAASAIFIWVAVLYCGHMLPFIGNAF